MSHVSRTGYILIGCVGGAYAIVSGLAMMLIGAGIQGNILVYMAVSTLFPQLTEKFLAYLSMIIPALGSLTLGPLAGYFAGTLIWNITTFGMIVSVHGFIILMSSVGAWTGNRWYAIMQVIFGLMGTFAFFNFGSLLGLISGVVLWQDLK
ncbi:MAG: hypothetical protein ACTSUQ_13765 [Candidatus Freyarchaeota archaeon]